MEKLNFWELIEANKRQTVILFLFLFIILMLLGFFIGYFSGGGFKGGAFGILGALVLWVIFAIGSYFMSDQIILNISGAGIPDKETFKPLYNILDEVKLAAGLNFRIDLLVVDEESPNAFTLGKKPEQSVIVLTSGLLAQFGRDEIQAVLAHEVAHIIHRDNFLMSNAVALGWLIIILSLVLQGKMFSGSSERSSSSRMPKSFTLFIISFIFSILAPIVAIIIIKSISKKRVYLADATAVRLTRFPAALISAMDKISVSTVPYLKKNKMTSILFFDDPYTETGYFFKSHPPLNKRIRVLEALGNSVNYYDYSTAFSRVTRKERLMPMSLLRDTETLPIINSIVANKPLFSSNSTAHIMANDIIRSMLNYTFIACDKCGMQFKLPEDFSKPVITCPRCGNEIKNPHVPVESISGDTKEEKPIIHNITIKEIAGKEHYFYKRKNKHSWETFTCICGDAKQLSPSFEGKQFYCSNCGRKIEIE